MIPSRTITLALALSINTVGRKYLPLEESAIILVIMIPIV